MFQLVKSNFVMAKLYYSIKEVSEEIDEEQHVLRYWEKEFSVLKPKKNKAGNRTYSLKDLIILKKIKDLVREQRISVKDVKVILKKINWNLEKDLIVVNDEVVKVNVSFEKNSLDDLDESDNKEIEINDKAKLVENDKNEVLTIKDVDFKQENLSEDKKENIDTFELVIEKRVDDNFDKTLEIQEIEKSLNFEIDKKIILKNHLFEDYEEFSIIPAEFINNEKEKNTKQVNLDLEKIDQFQEKFQEKFQENNENGILLSKEKLEILIDILKEIRKLI